jgi:small subunit ribosomal protein S7
MFYRGLKKENICEIDPILQSRILNIFVTHLIRKGNKSQSYREFYAVIYAIKRQTKGTPVAIIEHRVRIVQPIVSIRSVRLGGTVYQVPVEVSKNVRIFNSMHWILTTAATRKRKNIVVRLSEEIIDCVIGIGGAVRKRDEVHRIAEANKAFSRYTFLNI